MQFTATQIRMQRKSKFELAINDLLGQSELLVLGNSLRHEVQGHLRTILGGKEAIWHAAENDKNCLSYELIYFVYFIHSFVD